MAGIKAAADNAAARIFEEFSEYTKLCDYIKRSATTLASFDPSSSATEDNSVDLSDVTMVVIGFKDRDIDGERIQHNDMKAFAKAADITGILPIRTDDAIIVKSLPNYPASKRFEIKSFKAIPSPANASVYKFHLRSISA